MSRLTKFIGIPVIALAFAFAGSPDTAEAGGFSIRIGNSGFSNYGGYGINRGYGNYGINRGYGSYGVTRGYGGYGINRGYGSSFHRSYRPSYGHSYHGVRSYSVPIYGTHPAYHPRRPHYDYHPPSVIRHGNHYDVTPGHFDLHHGNHYHH